MSAAVEVSGFEAAFVSRAVPAWHLLGTVVPNDTDLTTPDVLRLAHLDGWDVRKDEVTVKIGQGKGGHPVVIPSERSARDFHAITRLNPFDGERDVLSIVGGTYEPTQNETVASFADPLITLGARWETAGSILDGRKIFFSLALASDIVLDPAGVADTIKRYILLASSHDGTMPNTFAFTGVRVVCQNTLNMALARCTNTVKVRHTPTGDERLKIASNVFAAEVAFSEVLKIEAETLLQTACSDDTFWSLVDSIYPAKAEPSKRGATVRAQKIDTLEGIWKGTGDGPDTMTGITGTLWGAYNAITEYQDWYRKPRKGEAENVAVAAAGFDSVHNGKRQDVYAKVRALLPV